MKRNLFLLGYFLIFSSLTTVHCQKSNKVNAQESTISSLLYEGLNYRCIGPFRGGRSAAVTGVANEPLLYYFGSTGGGVWSTTDGGQTWSNISDGFFGGSIGAIAVAESDHNVIYVGGGEKTVRGNVSYGYGIFKSVNGGRTWAASGLAASKHISRIRIHPTNSDIAYAAVMGDLYQATDMRGVYKTINGGQTWNQVLFANNQAGAVDLIIDPGNSRVIYASTWRIKRSPYELSSGGEGSALWKSIDEGATWTEISKHPGFAMGPIGIIGIAVSPANSDRLYAIVEAPEGGVFRSDDGGMQWKRVNEDRNLRQRAWYYSRIYADPKDVDGLYVLNVRYHHSTDGGQTFESAGAPHGDHHDLWISPHDPARMIIADDGGAQVSFDQGENWSSYLNQPTAQFYRVVTDNSFPFRIYGAQQDNSTIRIAHRTEGGSIGATDWESTAGGESAHLAVDPLNNDIVYGGSYGGYLVRLNHATGERQAINVWPDNPMGHGAEGMKYRFQWNFPIFFSPHNPSKLYAASNHLHVSYNGGHSWEVISPDLTRNDPEKLKSSGGPITQDNTGVEYYCTIFAATESVHESDVIYCGSDDGLVYITRDGGSNWTNITPRQMPDWMMINSIEVDPFNPAGAYVAGTRYKSGDYRPYLYRTKNYGSSWELITSGIDEDHFTRVVRADPVREGLLYAGTETGIYISYDAGLKWHPFQLNLPVVPVTDLSIKDNMLIVATQGRSFWMLDDLTVLHQLQAGMEHKKAFLFRPEPAWRYGQVAGNRISKTVGQNHKGGVSIFFWLSENTDSTKVTLKLYDSGGQIIKSFSTTAKSENEKLKIVNGLNTFIWDMSYSEAKGFPGLILWAGSLRGPKAIPGAYSVELIVNGQSHLEEFMIMADPRSKATNQDLQEQFDFLIQTRDKLTLIHEAIIDMRKVKTEVNIWMEKSIGNPQEGGIKKLGQKLIAHIDLVEKALYQTKNQSGQDPLNFPIRLNNKLAHLSSLVATGNNAPSQQSYDFKDEIFAAIDIELDQWKQIMASEIPAFNDLVKRANIDPVAVKRKE